MESGVQTALSIVDSDAPLSTSASTRDGTKTVSKGSLSTAIVCAAQIIVAIVFIIASLFNLTFHPNENREFWLSLLWLNAGYLVPTPKIRSTQPPSVS